MLGLWLAHRPSVVHLATWAPTPGALCNTLGWHSLTDREWDDQLQRMVYSTADGRLVLSDVLQGAPEHLPVCRRCLARWRWQDNVVQAEVRARG